MRPLVETVVRDGKLGVRWNLHRGQRRALNSVKRFILVLAGWQSGKTEVGPPWLWREMVRCGPGDYLVASPTYPLMMKKVLPVFVRLFERLLKLGHFVAGKNIFTFTDEGSMRLWGHIPDDPARVLFGHAQDPESLESATVKAAWLDECGQNGFRVGSYEAVLGRLSIHQGRILMTSRPYSLGWMKQLLWDPWEAAKRNHPEIEIVNFRSIDNPAFPQAEYYRAKAELPAWKFLMAYDGLFTRPAGLIYSSFDPDRHVIPRFNIPPEWPRFMGLDFGGVNTAAIFFAEERTSDGKPGPIVDGHVTTGMKSTGRLIAYKEYLHGDRSAAEHCYHLMRGDAMNPPEPRIPICAGGSASEGQWRREFAKGGTVNGMRVPGLPIHGVEAKAGATTVEVGIEKVFAAHTRNEILVFSDLKRYLDEKLSYSRELDEMGEPTAKIDSKETFHIMDSERYLVARLKLDKPKEVKRGTSVAHAGAPGW